MSNSSLVLAGMVCLVLLWWITARYLTRRPNPFDRLIGYTPVPPDPQMANRLIDLLDNQSRQLMDVLQKVVTVEVDRDPTPAGGITRPTLPADLDDAWDPTDSMIPDEPLLGWSPNVTVAEGDAPDLPTGHWTGLPLPVPTSAFTQTTTHSAPETFPHAFNR